MVFPGKEYSKEEEDVLDYTPMTNRLNPTGLNYNKRSLRYMLKFVLAPPRQKYYEDLES